MRKTLAAVTAGLLLVTDQAAAAGVVNAGERAGDRLGTGSESSTDFTGMPLPVLLIGAAIVIATIVVATDDDSVSG